mmetsp:Transcript_129940/g.417059  ORF Transcript_129940/g.417059 Transcript_129940/m.417059 type:complete len:282 (+) Transcript_129940:98-943(+)
MAAKLGNLQSFFDGSDAGDDHTCSFLGESSKAAAMPRKDPFSTFTDSDSDSSSWEEDLAQDLGWCCEQRETSTSEMANQKVPTDTLGHVMNTEQIENMRKRSCTNPTMPSHTNEGPSIRVGSSPFVASRAVNTGSASSGVAGLEIITKQPQQQDKLRSLTGGSQSHAPVLAGWKVWHLLPTRPCGTPTMRSRSKPVWRGRSLSRAAVQPRYSASESGSVPSGSAIAAGRLGAQLWCASPKFGSEPRCAFPQIGSEPWCASPQFGSKPRCASPHFGSGPAYI